MKKTIDKFESIVLHIDSGLERVTGFFWYLGGLLIVLMAFVTAYGAIARYVFRSPVALTYDLTSLLMFLCVALCLPYTQKLGRHLRLDLFDSIFPKAVTELIINIVGPLLGLLFCAVLAWQCWDNAFFALSINEVTKSTTPIPTFPIKIIFTIFFALLCLVLILQIVKYPFEVRKRRSEAE